MLFKLAGLQKIAKNKLENGPLEDRIKLSLKNQVLTDDTTMVGIVQEKQRSTRELKYLYSMPIQDPERGESESYRHRKLSSDIPADYKNIDGKVKKHVTIATPENMDTKSTGNDRTPTSIPNAMVKAVSTRLKAFQEKKSD